MKSYCFKPELNAVGEAEFLRCAFDEIRFKWKAAEEQASQMVQVRHATRVHVAVWGTSVVCTAPRKEKLKIEHHQRMRKARVVPACKRCRENYRIQRHAWPGCTQARAQARLDVIARERKKRLMQVGT